MTVTVWTQIRRKKNEKIRSNPHTLTVYSELNYRCRFNCCSTDQMRNIRDVSQLSTFRPDVCVSNACLHSVRMANAKHRTTVMMRAHSRPRRYAVESESMCGVCVYAFMPRCGTAREQSFDEGNRWECTRFGEMCFSILRRVWRGREERLVSLYRFVYDCSVFTLRRLYCEHCCRFVSQMNWWHSVVVSSSPTSKKSADTVFLCILRQPNFEENQRFALLHFPIASHSRFVQSSHESTTSFSSLHSHSGARWNVINYFLSSWFCRWHSIDGVARVYVCVHCVVAQGRCGGIRNEWNQNAKTQKAFHFYRHLVKLLNHVHATRVQNIIDLEMWKVTCHSCEWNFSKMYSRTSATMADEDDGYFFLSGKSVQVLQYQIIIIDHRQVAVSLCVW